MKKKKLQRMKQQQRQKNKCSNGSKGSNRKELKVETGKNQDTFTFEKATAYIKNEYKEDYDYMLEHTQVENGKKYYQMRVRTTYKIEGAAGSGFTGVFKVFEDGTIVEVH